MLLDRTFVIKIDEETYQRIKLYSRFKDQSFGETTRTALKEFLDRVEKK